MIGNLVNRNEAMKINFILSKDNDEIQLMHSESDKIEIMTGNKTNKIIRNSFNFLLYK